MYCIVCTVMGTVKAFVSPPSTLRVLHVVCITKVNQYLGRWMKIGTKEICIMIKNYTFEASNIGV